MNQRSKQMSTRREFLAASSIPIMFPLIRSTGFAASSATEQGNQPLATEPISVGYWLKSGPIATTGGNDRAQPIDIKPEMPKTDIGRAIGRVPELSAKEAARGGAGFQPDVISAQNAPRTFFLSEPKARIGIRGLYTAGHQWSDGDIGTFLMRVEFRPIKVCCQTVSTVTLGQPLKLTRTTS